MKTLRTDSHLTIIRKVKQDNAFALWVWFCTVRSVHTTKSVHGSALRNFPEFSRSTNTKSIKHALKKGWLHFDASNDRYYFKSMYTIAEEYKVPVKKLKEFKGDTLLELLARAAGKYLEKNITQQHIKEGNYTREDKVSIKSKHNRCFHDDVVFSTRSLCELVGYNSTFAATKLFREAERLGIIKRKRRYKYLGDVVTVGAIYPTCFTVSGQVYERLTSSVCVA
jgi:hypothetical protein